MLFQYIAQIITLMDIMEPYNPPSQFYQFKEDAWVEFSTQEATKECQQCGYVKKVDNQYAFMIDEHTLAEVHHKEDQEQN